MINNKLINNDAIRKRCKEWGVGLSFIFAHVDFSRKDLYRAGVVKTDGRCFAGRLSRDTDDIAKSIARVLQVKANSLIIDLKKIEFTCEVITTDGYLIDRSMVGKHCKIKERSVKWALDKAGIKYSNYNDMTYARVKNGKLEPIRKLDTAKIKKLAEILECRYELLVIGISHIEI
jgi:hypothetical protein